MRENNNKTRTIEDYSDTLRLLIRLIPATRGPCNITVALAKEFKSLYQGKYTRQKPKAAKVWKGRGRKPKPPLEPASYSRKARTVASRLNKLRVICSKWFIEELSYLTVNPWEEVAPPKLDKLTPRYLTAEEVVAFFGWLTERWDGWRLPVLFFTVKGFLGNRIGELCALRTEQLREGRVVFAADATKSRKERKAILPAEVYAELKAQAGPVWVWERFPDQLRERLEAQERMTRNVKPDFHPNRLKWWLQDEIDDYCKAHPTVQRFSAHAFRKRAITEAWKLGIPLEKAAVAFGCNPNTMRAHYIAMDETAVADEVLNAIAETVRLAQRPDASTDVPQAG
jgi:integrase